MRRRPVIVPAAAAAAALALGACGGGSSSSGGGVASQSASQIVTTAANALRTVSSVHVAGNVSEGASGTLGLDLRLVPGKGATGTMTQNGSSVRLVILGQQVYLNGGAAFWRKAAGATVAQKLAGHWIKGPSAQFGGLADELTVNELLKGLLDNHGGLVKGGSTTVGGRRAVSVVDHSKGGTLDVAATGTPYPLQLSNSGADGGKVTFGDFNAPVSLTAPAGAQTPTQLAK
jgi:hypothetical protein